MNRAKEAYLQSLERSGFTCEKKRDRNFILSECRLINVYGRCFQCEAGQSQLLPKNADSCTVAGYLSEISRELIQGRPVEIRILPRGVNERLSSAEQESLQENNLFQTLSLKMTLGDEESLESILQKVVHQTKQDRGFRLLKCCPNLGFQKVLLKVALLCLRHSFQIGVRFR